ncbi:hypothetical protein PHLCEN_2v850, partial [Hermanssonia centrifuga]
KSMAGCGWGRRRRRAKAAKADAEVAPQKSIQTVTAKKATAHHGQIDVNPSASMEGSGTGIPRASDAKARRARHVGSMSLDEKLRLLEEVAAALNKDQKINRMYLPASHHGSGTGSYSRGSGAHRHSSVPPSTPEEGSDSSDIEMFNSDEVFNADEIDDPMEMTPTEVYDSDTDMVPPATDLKRCHAMAVVVHVEDVNSNGPEQTKEPEPEPEVVPATSVPDKGNGQKRNQDEDAEMEGGGIPPVASTIA